MVILAASLANAAGLRHQVAMRTMNVPESSGPALVTGAPKQTPPDDTPPKFQMVLTSPSAPIPGEALTINLTLTRLRDGATAGPKTLPTHPRAVVVDALLRDAQVLTPRYTGGHWQVSFTPKEAGAYHLWLDATPRGQTKQEWLHTWLGAPPSEVGPVSRPVKLRDGTASLRVPDLDVGEPAELTLLHAKLGAALVFSGDGNRMEWLMPSKQGRYRFTPEVAGTNAIFIRTSQGMRHFDVDVDD